MPPRNQFSHATSLHRPLLLLVLAGALGACGEGSAAPGLLALDRGAHDFGQLHVGETSAERVFTVRNAGPDPLDELSVRLEPAGSFTLLGTTCAGWLAPSETCTITVAFAPARAGAVQAEVVVEADRADASAALTGVGAVTVRVVNNVIGSRTVESEPAGIRCGVACEATFTVPDVVLFVAGGGGAVWSAPCETTPENRCVLASLAGDTVVTLEDIVAPQWVFDRGRHTAVVIDAQNDVIATRYDAPSLFKLSSAGELVWGSDELDGGLAAAVDAEGNIGFAGFAGLVRKFDGDGNEQWSMDAGLDLIGDMAFDPSGALLVAGTQGTDGDDVVLLVKLGSDGQVLWSRTHDLGTDHYVVDLVVDGSGNVFVSGGGTRTPDDGGGAQAFVRMYDGDGNFVSTITDAGGELAMDALGNLFVYAEPRVHKYSPDGFVIWDAYLGDGVSGISSLAVTPAGDVVAAGTRYVDGIPASMWIAKLDGATGTRRRPVELQGEAPFYGQIAVDGSGDVVIAGGDGDFGLRKYDGALFDRPDE